MSDKISALKTVKVVLAIIVSIVTVVAAIYGFEAFIDSRIERVVNGEQFIRKVSSYVRPFVIFDGEGAVLVDGGACEYLEKLEVLEGKKDGNIIPVKITVTPKHHLAYPPLIEKLGAGHFMDSPNPKRGTGHQWIYECEVLHWENDPIPARFRLEILQ